MDFHLKRSSFPGNSDIFMLVDEDMKRQVGVAVGEIVNVTALPVTHIKKQAEVLV
jgi:hypothetical protein